MLSVLPRAAAAALGRHLRIMPAVVLTGARQTGKTTLAQNLPPGRRRFETLDDFETERRAAHEPHSLLGGALPVTLDEVQREPKLLRAVKTEIDRRRTPGRFLLAGSANLLLMRRVSESLAGRASHLDLWPMTRREQRGEGSPGAWDDLLDTADGDWFDLLGDRLGPRVDWRAWARRGGFPTPAVHLRTADDRAVWFEAYLRTYLQRDLSDLAEVGRLPDFRKLMHLSAARLGQQVHQTSLSRDCALSQPTVGRYLNLLETSYQLVRLRAYATNRGKRVLRTPKLYWGDTGVALHLAGNPVPDGAHFENLVLLDLLVWRASRSGPAEVFYWRTTTGEEVDFVIESDGRLLPVEVKATAHPRPRDARGLLAFRDQYGDASRYGLLLHTGESLRWLSGEVLAAPWWTVI